MQVPETKPASNDSLRTKVNRYERKRGINWGAPNGLDIAEYGNIGDWDDIRWRWEFLRRRDDVRQAYQNAAFDDFREMSHAPGVPTDLIWRDDYRNQSFYLSPSGAARLGYGRLANPLYSTFDDSEALLPSLDRRTLVPWHIGNSENQFDVIGIGQIAIVFDPNKPITPQITGLEKHLLHWRNHSISNDIERAHPDKWLTYLRLLDARVSGASWQNCADSIVPSTTAQSIGTARDQHKQALRLQAYL